MGPRSGKKSLNAGVGDCGPDLLERYGREKIMLEDLPAKCWGVAGLEI